MSASLFLVSSFNIDFSCFLFLSSLLIDIGWPFLYHASFYLLGLTLYIFNQCKIKNFIYSFIDSFNRGGTRFCGSGQVKQRILFYFHYENHLTGEIFL